MSSPWIRTAAERRFYRPPEGGGELRASTWMKSPGFWGWELECMGRQITCGSSSSEMGARRACEIAARKAGAVELKRATR